MSMDQDHPRQSLVVHIGLPKTGTTYLQYKVFAVATPDSFLHRKTSDRGLRVCNLLRNLARRGKGSEIERVSRMTAKLDRLFDDGPATRTVFISDENISVRARSFWKGRGPQPEPLARRFAGVRHLSKRFDQVRVLMGIRRQDQWLASRYAESSKLYKKFGQDDFDRRMKRIGTSSESSTVLDWLDYHYVYRVFKEHLGERNVFLFDMNDLRDKKQELLSNMQEFVDAENQMSFYEASEKNSETVNNLSVGEGRWRLRRDDTVLELAPATQAAIMARFEDSNRELEAILPIRLRA